MSAAKKRPATHSATNTCISASRPASSSHAYPHILESRAVCYTQKRLIRATENYLDGLVQLRLWENAIFTGQICLSVRYARLFRFPAMH